MTSPRWGITAKQGRDYIRHSPLTGCPPGSVNRRLHLFEQLFTAIGLGNKPAQPLRQQGRDFVLLRKSTAQHYVHPRIKSLQFGENRVSVDVMRLNRAWADWLAISTS